MLREHGVEPEIFEYLKTPPSAEELDAILGRLGMAPRDLMRRQEKEYKKLGLDDESLTRDQLIEAMVEHPKLIERPIAVSGERAVMGRPTARVLVLI